VPFGDRGTEQSERRTRHPERVVSRSTDDPHRSDERDLRRPADLVLTVGVFVAVFAALMPLLGVVRAWPWLAGATFLTAAVLAAGYVARRYRLPALAVSLIELGLWALVLTFLFFRDSALLWFIPTPTTLREIPEALTAASNEIALGAAPLQASAELSFLIVGAAALLAIIVDHVVLTARMPLLAGVGLIAVSLIPSIAVPRGIEVSSFVLLAAAILFLIRADTRSKEPRVEREVSRAAGVSATALGIGAIAVVVAVVAAPLLPQPSIQPGAGPGVGPGIDVSLQLGDDLRRPRETVALLVRSDLATPPYLRAATLSQFNGSIWEPDRSRSVPLSSEFALSEVSVEPDIRVTEYTTTVQVQDLVSPWLPVAFPAVAVSGLEGEWEAVPYNRTIISRTGSTSGQAYKVVTHVPRPTLEQMREANAGGPQIRDETTRLPEGLPPIIGETAAEVTAASGSDYDALADLQRFFRSGEFRYSLDAPVEEGFDGSGAEAVARFLEVREGYCVHFASAFALMARTLGMPSRIVVGYLPGSATTDSIDGQTVYSVASSQLHAWPEVFFDGIGWIPFEPTTGLGVPTTFAPAATLPADGDDPQDVTSTPSASASAPLPEDELNGGDPGQSDAGPSTTSINPLPSLGIGLVILLLLGIPGLVRATQTRTMLRAADEGDAVAAWLVVVDAAIDLGIPVPASESPRGLGRRLIDDHGAPLAETTQLVRAIERASYAQGGRHRHWESTPMSAAAAHVRSALFAEVSPSRRLIAVLAPRSLVIRPGSVYAGAGARVRAHSGS
jgi:transglutaminase-like putative cysteine protease